MRKPSGYSSSHSLGESWDDSWDAECGDCDYYGQNDEIDKFVALYEEEIIKDNTGKPIRVKTLGQNFMWTVLNSMM